MKKPISKGYIVYDFIYTIFSKGQGWRTISGARGQGWCWVWGDLQGSARVVFVVVGQLCILVVVVIAQIYTHGVNLQRPHTYINECM